MPLYLTRFSYTPETWARLIKGEQDLVPQTISHDELRANAFNWSVEVQPSYVVP